jgi:hypothetical protein
MTQQPYEVHLSSPPCEVNDVFTLDPSFCRPSSERCSQFRGVRSYRGCGSTDASNASPKSLADEAAAELDLLHGHAPSRLRHGATRARSPLCRRSRERARSMRMGLTHNNSRGPRTRSTRRPTQDMRAPRTDSSIFLHNLRRSNLPLVSWSTDGGGSTRWWPPVSAFSVLIPLRTPDADVTLSTTTRCG